MKTRNKLTREQLFYEMRETKISCGKCGTMGHLSPIGFLCPHCRQRWQCSCPVCAVCHIKLTLGDVDYWPPNNVNEPVCDDCKNWRETKIKTTKKE